MSKVKTFVKQYKVQPYKDAHIVVRRIGEEYFEYVLAWRGQVYSSFILATPDEGKKKITKLQELAISNYLWILAESTVDFNRGESPSPEDTAKAKQFIELGKKYAKV